MRLSIFIFLAGQLFYTSAKAQVYGCMDPHSSNYNSLATVSDGSCVYPDATVTLKNLRKATLPNTVKEISGIISFDGKLYGHNDSGGQPAIYQMDTISGAITKTITLQGATNVDWEDITQDDSYLYIGDIGNNESGDRTDLKIYRFPKQDIKKISGSSGTIPSADIDIINFRYEDQTDFSPLHPNSTRYDCEAMVYDNGKLHLFTKNWTSNYTVHYVVNATPTGAVQLAVRKDSLNTGGVVITSAARIDYETTVLLGYQVTGVPSGFMWVVSRYGNMNEIFTSGNKQKINLGPIVDGINTGIGQVEGIALADAERVFISNEYFSRVVGSLTFTVPQSLYGLDISRWTPEYIALANGIRDLSASQDKDKMLVAWRCELTGVDHFNIESSNDGVHFSIAGTVSAIADTDQYKFTDGTTLPPGHSFYRIKIVMKNGNYSYSKIVTVDKQQEKHFGLTAFPSPFNQTLQLSVYSDKEQQLELSLVDLYGRKLLTRTWNCARGDNKWKWANLPALSKSVYFITAQSEDDLLVKKIVRN